jgi:hypothetical protein
MRSSLVLFEAYEKHSDPSINKYSLLLTIFVISLWGNMYQSGGVATQLTADQHLPASIPGFDFGGG